MVRFMLRITDPPAELAQTLHNSQRKRNSAILQTPNRRARYVSRIRVSLPRAAELNCLLASCYLSYHQPPLSLFGRPWLPGLRDG